MRTDVDQGGGDPPATGPADVSTHPVGRVRTQPLGPLMLAPATRLLWRSPDSVHLEMGGRAVLVEGLTVPTVREVARPVISRPPRRPVPGASSAPLPSPSAAAPRRTRGARAAGAPECAALGALVGAGFLWPRPSGTPEENEQAVPGGNGWLLPPTPRLAGELAALSARHGPAAADLLSARQRATVLVTGTSRVAVQLAAVLAAAGVGRVRCEVDGTARLRHCTPGGIRPADEGQHLGLAADLAVKRAAPEVDTAPLPTDGQADLTVLAVDGPVSDDRRRALHAFDAAHLVVTLGPDSGVVGPLVLPGLTSCLRCADLHRLDRDPAWNALAAQLSVPGRYGTPSEVAVTTVISGAAAMQALAFLDGDEPAVLDATVELHSPDWRLRRRSWPPHPDCDCMRPRGSAPPVPAG